MRYVLGIDIGTSFTAAAIARLGDEPDPRPQALNLGRHGASVPSVIFLDDDGRVLVGEAAERRGLGRPDRMVREFKRRIGDQVPIAVGDLQISAEHVFATMARWVVDRAEEREGAPPESVMLSHPASWGTYKTSLVRSALAGVGLADVMLLTEPQAAVLHYATEKRVDIGTTIAVYDLGGGTFDVAAVTKTDADRFDVLGVAGGLERLGGADFDDLVFRHVATSLGDSVDALDATNPAVLIALSHVRRECREAKEALSFDTEATIPVLLPDTQTQVRLVRSEFESMISDAVHETIRAFTEALDTAGVRPADVGAILLIGGSSRIPLVSQLLSEQLARPIAIDVDPKASISLGAAFAAASSQLAATAIDAADAADRAEIPVAIVPVRAGLGSRLSARVADRAAQFRAAHPRVNLHLTTAAAMAGALALTGVVWQVSTELSESQPPASSTASEADADADADAGILGSKRAAAAPVANPSGPDAALPPSTPGAAQPAPPASRNGSQRPPNAGMIGDTRPNVPRSAVTPLAPQPAAPGSGGKPATSSLTPGSPVTPRPEPTPRTTPDPTPHPVPDPTSDPVPDPVPSPAPDTNPDPVPHPTPDPTPDPTPIPVPGSTPNPDSTPTPIPDPPTEPTLAPTETMTAGR
ncbi:Hsp70 family protein [Salinibacterium sp. ZJ450]|uniref:Hsp70 family protein n=1 Tax=Salinibacterium sp. ZJ450 TaxID=2708338 RepID=UPI001422EB89|nr:Hsp70 family protein [Salinibacterium sp. ZJ450]